MSERKSEIVCLGCEHPNPPTAPRCEVCGDPLKLPVCRRCGRVVAPTGNDTCPTCLADSTNRLELAAPCPRCGLHNPADQQICAGCGTNVNQYTTDAERAAAAESEPPADDGRVSAPPVPAVPEPPIVGRDDEVEQLLELVAGSVGQRVGGLMALFGGPGSGKTRILDELIEQLEDLAPDTLVIRTACREASEEPYDPLPKLLQARFDFEPGLDDISRRIAVTRLVGKVFDQQHAKWVTEVSHLLGHLAGIPFPQSPVLRSLEGKPQRFQVRIHQALQRFVEADAQPNGVVWIIDDLHHASPEALLMLADLVFGLEEVPFVVVAAGLLSMQGTLKVDEDRQVHLGPVSDEAMGQFFTMLLPGLPEMPEELTEAAVERAGGNPASMREIARLLLESGVVDASTDPWRTDLSRLAASDLPVSLEEALRARRQRLDERTRAVLERAAVIGEVFWDEAVLALSRGSDTSKDNAEPANIWPDDSETMAQESTLRRLEDSEFVVPLEGSEFPRVREYAFRHAGLRDQIYADIDADVLRQSHLLAAQWFESATGALRDNFLEQIAEHWERAGEHHHAAQVLIEAATQARTRSLNQKAIRLFERGLSGLAERDRILRMEALHDLGSVYELVGEYDIAMERLTEMLRDAWALVHRGKAGAACNKMGRIHRARGDYPAARAYLQRGLQLFRAADDTRGVASSLDDLGNLYWLLGHYQRALDHSAEALEIRRSLGDRRGEAVSLINIGHIEAARGYLNEADACYREALDIARGIGDRDTECKSLNAIGTILYRRNDAHQAIEIWRAALTIAEDIGDRRMQSFLLNNLGEALTIIGDRASAERYLLDCEALAQDRDDRRVLAEVYRNLGALMMRHDEVRQARNYLDNSLKTSREMGSKEAVGMALRGLGELLGRTLFIDDGSNGEDATSYFYQAVEIFERIGNEVELAHTLNALGTYFLEHDSLDRAKDSLERARDIFARLESPERDRLDATISDISESVELSLAESSAELDLLTPDDTVPGIPSQATIDKVREIEQERLARIEAHQRLHERQQALKRQRRQAKAQRQQMTASAIDPELGLERPPTAEAPEAPSREGSVPPPPDFGSPPNLGHVPTQETGEELSLDVSTESVTTPSTPAPHESSAPSPARPTASTDPDARVSNTPAATEAGSPLSLTTQPTVSADDDLPLEDGDDES